jgi:hypothetical protein
MFVDRAYTSDNHIEIFCLTCGSREIYHNFTNEDRRPTCLASIEKKRAHTMIVPF